MPARPNSQRLTFERLLRARTLPLLAVMAIAALLGGCSNDSTSPADENHADVLIEGVAVPQVVIEGESGTLSVWGTCSSTTRTVESIDLDVIRPAADDETGLLRVSVVTSRAAAPGEPHAPFQVSVELPDLVPGDYDVEFEGSDRREHVSVFPGEGWIWYRSRTSTSFAGEGLMVHRDGVAVAYRDGAGRPARARLEPAMVEEIPGWFVEAGFADLAESYISDVADERRFEIAYRETAPPKRVVADEHLAPDELLVLARRLSGLIDKVLSDRPEPQLVLARLAVEPPEADAGTPRHIRLAVTNHTLRPVTLTFPTSQLYDLLVVHHMGPRDGSHDGDFGGPLSGPGHNGPDVLVWNWAHGRDFLQVITDVTLQPGETKVYEETWDGRSNTGDIARSGVYEVAAFMPSHPQVPVRPTRLVVNPENPTPHGLVASLAIDPEIGPPGTARELTLSVSNPTDHPIDVVFYSTKQYDFAIENPLAYRPGFLWLWSVGRGFGDVVFTDTWAPGETKTFTEVWDGTIDDGVTVEPGRYVAHGWLETEGHPPMVRARPVPFAIAP